MSVAFSDPSEIFGSPSDHLRRHLEEPRFLAWLSSIVRRRVPSSDVDDVVQAVLCDALASHLIPSDHREISRWICGIAKNKVADFHRRAKRQNESHEEIAIGARSGEMRVMLRSVVADASARNREALEWIVREHDGEELASIAEELSIPAPLVRQRVSRLRRALRSRWLGGGVLVLALAMCAGYE
ncbi:MAG: sigma factor, partial [Polyangiaceae bacterium]